MTSWIESLLSRLIKRPRRAKNHPQRSWKAKKSSGVTSASENSLLTGPLLIPRPQIAKKRLQNSHRAKYSLALTSDRDNTSWFYSFSTSPRHSRLFLSLGHFSGSHNNANNGPQKSKGRKKTMTHHNHRSILPLHLHNAQHNEAQNILSDSQERETQTQGAAGRFVSVWFFLPFWWTHNGKRVCTGHTKAIVSVLLVPWNWILTFCLCKFVGSARGIERTRERLKFEEKNWNSTRNSLEVTRKAQICLKWGNS